MTRSAYDTDRPNYVYVAVKPNDRPCFTSSKLIYKIGMTNEPETRMKAVGCELLKLFPMRDRADAYRYERACHIHFGNLSIGNEYFDFEDYTPDALTELVTLPDTHALCAHILLGSDYAQRIAECDAVKDECGDDFIRQMGFDILHFARIPCEPSIMYSVGYDPFILLRALHRIDRRHWVCQTLDNYVNKHLMFQTPHSEVFPFEVWYIDHVITPALMLKMWEWCRAHPYFVRSLLIR